MIVQKIVELSFNIHSCIYLGVISTLCTSCNTDSLVSGVFQFIDRTKSEPLTIKTYTTAFPFIRSNAH